MHHKAYAQETDSQTLSIGLTIPAIAYKINHVDSQSYGKCRSWGLSLLCPWHHLHKYSSNSSSSDY